MPILDLPEVSLYYEDKGESDDTIVFAHSMLFNMRMFDRQVEALSTSYRCISVDLPGQGKSGASAIGYDLDAQTRILQKALEKLKVSHYHFAGFSMGGMIGMRLAVKYPDVVKSLILIDTSAEPEPDENRFRNSVMLWVAKHLGTTWIAGRVIKMFFGKAFLNDPTRSAEKEVWRQHFLANDRYEIVKVVRAVVSRKGVSGQLHQIKAPTLILVGEEDQLTPPDMSRKMKKEIPNARLVLVPRAAHMSTVEEPAEINRLISDWLQNNSDR